MPIPPSIGETVVSIIFITQILFLITSNLLELLQIF